jgi:hypothetical protein
LISYGGIEGDVQGVAGEGSMMNWPLVSAGLALLSIGLAVWSIVLSWLSQNDLRRAAELRRCRNSLMEKGDDQRHGGNHEGGNRNPVGLQRTPIGATGD